MYPPSSELLVTAVYIIIIVGFFILFIFLEEKKRKKKDPVAERQNWAGMMFVLLWSVDSFNPREQSQTKNYIGASILQCDLHQWV